jgi:hypothetical protein
VKSAARTPERPDSVHKSVVITTIAPEGHPLLHRVALVGTYAAIGLFLWCNRRISGVRLIGVGAFLNALVITLNGGRDAGHSSGRTARRHAPAGRL